MSCQALNSPPDVDLDVRRWNDAACSSSTTTLLERIELEYRYMYKSSTYGEENISGSRRS